jgi:hypothetical protein
MWVVVTSIVWIATHAPSWWALAPERSGQLGLQRGFSSGPSYTQAQLSKPPTPVLESCTNSSVFSRLSSVEAMK